MSKNLNSSESNKIQIKFFKFLCLYFRSFLLSVGKFSSDLFSGSIIGLVSPVSGSNSILNRFSTSVPFFQNMTGAMTLEKNAMTHLHLRDESEFQRWIFEVKFFIEKYRGDRGIQK